jgi:hypothetical protein
MGLSVKVSQSVWELAVMSSGLGFEEKGVVGGVNFSIVVESPLNVESTFNPVGSTMIGKTLGQVKRVGRCQVINGFDGDGFQVHGFL